MQAGVVAVAAGSCPYRFTKYTPASPRAIIATNAANTFIKWLVTIVSV